MALVTTFATTPLTSTLFPPWYQKKLAAWKRGEIDWEGNRLSREDSTDDSTHGSADKATSEIRKLLVCLRLDSLPSLFTFVDLLGGEKTSSSTMKVHPSLEGKAAVPEAGVENVVKLPKRPLEVHGLRMLELTERLSSVMKESEVEEWSARDPVVNAFHTFGQLHNVAVSGDVQLVPEGSYANVLSERATDRRSDMILLPWSETGSLSEVISLGLIEPTQNAFGHDSYNRFVDHLLASAPCSTAVLVNNGFGALPRDEPKALKRTPTSMSLRSLVEQHPTAPIADRSHHIFLPFLGGLDDHVALKFVLRLAQNPNVTATIVFIPAKDDDATDSVQQSEISMAKDRSTTITATQTREPSSDQDRSFFDSMRSSLPDEMHSRVVFEHADSSTDVVDRARSQVGLNAQNAGDLVVVGRRRLHAKDANPPTSPRADYHAIRQTLGETAEAMIQGNVKASVLVVKAGGVGQ